MATDKDRDPLRRSRLGRLLLLWAAALVLMVGAVYLYTVIRKPAGREVEEIPLVERELGQAIGERAVVLVFPNWDATGYIIEERQLPSRDRLEADLLAVMSALCDGPTTGGAISAMPEGTHPLAAFYNEADGSVVLDFSRELVVNHPGGSAAESGTLTVILRTLALNFPEVRLCSLLVDGAQSETLAGHITMDHPFVPRRWL